MTIEIGRVCVKIAGRDAGKKCIIIDILDNNYVLIDGETRRRRCNILHLEPLNQVLKIEKDASHGDVARALKELGIEVRSTKPKQKAQKPKKKRKTPEQLRVQKEEKRKLKDIFKPKKKEEKSEKKEATLEDKAGLAEKESETKKPDKGVKQKEKKDAPKEITPKKNE